MVTISPEWGLISEPVLLRSVASVLRNTSDPYDVNKALNWNIELKDFRTFCSQNYLTLLEIESGKKDSSSVTGPVKQSACTICLEDKAPYNNHSSSSSKKKKRMEYQIKANDKQCPQSMITERGNGSNDVSDACLDEYPAFTMPDLLWHLVTCCSMVLRDCYPCTISMWRISSLLVYFWTGSLRIQSDLESQQHAAHGMLIPFPWTNSVALLN